MPIFDQGYQHWHGKLSGHATRWLTVARNGARAQLKNRWTRIVVLSSLIPAVALAVALIFWGLFEQKSDLIAPLMGLFQDLPDAIKSGPRQYRTTIWTIAYQYFFSFEIFIAMVLVLIVGPGLVSQDLRFNALPLYFSRPLRRFDYFLGKLGVIGLFLAGVAIVPSLVAYVLGLGFSLDFSVVKDTTRVLLAAVAFGLVVVVSAGTLMLAISSLSRNSRYVGLVWVAVWFVGVGVEGFVTEELKKDWGHLFSYTTNLSRVGRELLGTTEAWEQFEQVVEARPQMGPGSYGSMDSHRPDAARRRPARRPPDPERRKEFLQRVDGPLYPWYWSASVLAGLFGLSVCVLTTRVKSMDRLR
jgi:ABC-2 type transport system permease protein